MFEKNDTNVDNCINQETDKKQDLEEYIMQLENDCYLLESVLNAPELITRVKKLSYNLEDIENIYDLNEQMLETIRKMKAENK